MIKVMFVCLGNICRSPMAEFLFKDLVKKEGLENNFHIESSATSYEEVGNRVHRGTVNKLREVGISVGNKVAKKLYKEDYYNFDYFIGMDSSNIQDINRIFEEDKDKKVFKLLDFTKEGKDVADPWWTGNFDITYDDILRGLKAFLEYLKKKGEIY